MYRQFPLITIRLHYGLLLNWISTFHTRIMPCLFSMSHSLLIELYCCNIWNIIKWITLNIEYKRDIGPPLNLQNLHLFYVMCLCVVRTSVRDLTSLRAEGKIKYKFLEWLAFQCHIPLTTTQVYPSPHSPLWQITSQPRGRHINGELSVILLPTKILGIQPCCCEDRSLDWGLKSSTMLTR